MLQIGVAEGVEQNLITIAILQRFAQLPHQNEILVDVVLVQVRLEAGIVKDIIEGSESRLFLEEFACVSKVQECLEVAEGDC